MKVFIDSSISSKTELANTFILTLVNPEKVPSSRLGEASLFARWLQKEKGRKIIADFGRSVYEKPLFTPLSLRH